MCFTTIFITTQLISVKKYRDNKDDTNNNNKDWSSTFVSRVPQHALINFHDKWHISKPRNKARLKRH